MPSQPQNSQRGFTLVEALVSMSLLSIGLVPVYWQSTQALALSTQVKNTMIASNLAQEGVELARAVRDTNWLTQQPTWQGVDVGDCGTGCEASFDEAGLTPLSGSAARPLRFVPESGLYQYTSGNQSPFLRVITVSDTAVAGERIVTSRVSWREKGRDREVVLEYHLFDWLQ